MDAFAALADPNRRAIVELVAQRGELAASAIAAHFAISAPAVSQHLKVLREAGVLLMEKRAQQRIYRVNPAAMDAVAGWAQRVAGVWRGRFAALDALLEAEQRRSQPTQGEAGKASKADDQRQAE